MNEQNSLLKGIKLATNKKQVLLLTDIQIKQTRGLIKTDYECYLSQGTYDLIWKSNTSEFYLASDFFSCEDIETGGICMTNNKNYIWVYPNLLTSNEKSRQKFKTLEFVQSLTNMSSIKPFIHTYYQIKDGDIQIINDQ